jgi:predicted RNase H-like HicB family nuclease
MAQKGKVIEQILSGRSDYNPEVSAGRKSVSKYEVIIYRSEEDDTFVAEVPELAGCTADGATHQEALANAEIVIQEWIETAQESGRAIPEPKGRLIYA